MDPFYRMAHVYLFRTFYRLQTELVEKSGRVESVGTLFIEKLGFGTADLHYEMASELLKIKEKGSLRVLKVRFLFDNSAIKDFKTETARVVNLKDRGDFAGEIAQTGLWRVELLGRDRHCLDEAAFVPQRTICWDGINAAGQMTGGSKIVTTFSVELMLAMQQDAERVVIYDAVGKKAYEHRL
jgi:hypothetical protein